MSGPDRQDELLAARALEGLVPEEASELLRLRAAGDDGFDLAAAAVALGTIPPEPMPAELAAKVLAAAPSAGAARAAGPAVGPVGVAPIAGPAGVVRVVEPPARGPGTPKARPDLFRWGGWAVAAACLALAGAAWLRPPEVLETERLVVQSPPPVPPPAARREALLREAPDARTVAWAATKDPAAQGASGDVVWSGARQAGFMRIRGLQRNDRVRAQYQLWIFDAAREAAHPVDGGVFDVAGDEVVVPIDAAVAVDRPTLFAVTVERPGGVVVSRRERIVLAAAVAN
ncbi:MAG: anti-sigma factor [Anaeromyxobacter sp.]|nr:anti-sigma factor [Anaeromyxobacter sp.]